jgi:hypothetical protein
MKRILPILIGFNLLVGTAFGSNWWENIKLKGDLRYRHEMIDRQLEGDNNAPRNRHRIRARIGIEGRVNDITTAGVQLATGSDDPVSTNQTLDNGYSTKNIMLDMAYLTIIPSFADDLSATAGKFKNPFFKPGKSELLWDSDFNPEGGVLDYSGDLRDFSFTLIGAGLWVEERSSDRDSWMGAAQGVLEFDFNEDKSGLAVGGGMFNYVNAKGYEPFFDGDPRGNSVDTDGSYANEFELVEAFAEISHKVENMPVTAMVDFVTNTGADSLNNGWLAGIHVGKTRKRGSWAFRYIYRVVEKDAVVGTFADSDFRGGGTDADGHEMGGSYQLAENSAFNVTYFINTIGLEDDVKTDFRRLQVDLQLKF